MKNNIKKIYIPKNDDNCLDKEGIERFSKNDTCILIDKKYGFTRLYNYKYGNFIIATEEFENNFIEVVINY